MPHDDQPTVYLAAAVRDAAWTNARPGAVAVRNGVIVASGEVGEVRRAVGSGAPTVELPDRLILPPLVNAHAHLDLTMLGPRPFAGDFATWLGDVVVSRAAARDEIVSAVQRGLAMSADAGVGFIADIAASTVAASAGAGVRQVGGRACRICSFVECFGQGRREMEGIGKMMEQIRELGDALPSLAGLLGIQPHAPYSAGMGLYLAAARLATERGLLLSTHLAESDAEMEFVRAATGPLADMLRRSGKWDAAIKPAGVHPVDWFEPALREGRWLLAHGNYIQPRHLPMLAGHRASVAYCPRSSDYFGHPKGAAHPYRQLLDAGVNVCLGTDSILCQPPDEPRPLGILPQMRHLYLRDGTNPATLLGMATVNGLRALDIDVMHGTLRPGAAAGFGTVKIDPADRTDPLVQALRLQ